MDHLENTIRNLRREGIYPNNLSLDYAIVIALDINDVNENLINRKQRKWIKKLSKQLKKYYRNNKKEMLADTIPYDWEKFENDDI